MLRPFKLIQLILIFIKDLWVSNLMIAWDVITPGTNEQQGYVTIKLATKNDFHLFLLTSMITMTPGTLSIKIDERKTELLVHCLYNHDPKGIEEGILSTQRLIMEIF